MSQLPGNITELIAALEGLGKRNLNEEYELFETCRGVFEKLRRLSDFDPGDIKKIVKILKGLPPEIKELKIEELEDGDKKLETRALNKQDLKELLEDYEKATNENERKRIEKEIYARTGQKNVEQFIKIQKEIANKNAEKLSKLDEEIKEGVVENLTKIKLEEKEELIDIVEEASLEEKFDEKKLKREIKKRIKNPERVEEFIQKVEEIRAEIKIKERAEEIAKTTYEKLAEEKLPINGDIKEKIKNEILIAWKEGDRIKIPKELEEISEAKVIIKETEEAADIFKNKNIEAIVNYRSLELGKKTSQELRKNGVQDESLIREYVSVVKELTNNPDNARIEENRSDIYNFVQSENPNKGPGEMERSIDEARFIANNVVTSPKKFNKLIQKYNLLREKIGSDKLPKLKEVRVLEKMTTLFVNNPKMLKLLNGTQKVANIYNKVATFPSRMLGKLTVGVVEKIEGKLAKIGAQAATEFVKNSAAIIAKEGTAKGLGIILKSILGKGTVIAGEGAASGGAVAGLVTAFQALPVVGQIIAVVVVAAAAVLAVVKPIIDGAKKILEKVLGTNLNKIKKFVAEDLGLGKFIGGVAQFAFDLSVFFIGIPKLFGLIKFSATLTPIFIAFFAGTFLYNMLMHQQISSIVPPADLSGCILKRGSGPGGLPEGEINCDINAPENEVPGLISKEKYFDVVNRWSSGKKYLDECYNDVVNRSLCAGINPLYSLWVWMHESGASNYSLGRIQDFGINDSSIENNFDAQIKVFLNLDPASACDLNDPKLRGPDGYWLAWASRYLTGQCDPDVGQAQTGNMGRKYLEDMKNKTWPWIASVPLPKDIYVEKGGQNCEQEGAPFSLTGPTKEIIGDDGQTYICSTSGGGGPSTMNPGGAPVAGTRTQCPFDSYSHSGVWAMDWGADFGTPIFSTFSGIARLSEGNGYGFYIDIHSNYNGDDFFIRYGHMPPGGYRVGDGEAVAAGQQIGIVDNTGFSSGNHLHYEVVGANIDWGNAGPYFGMTQEEFNSACR